MMTSKVGKGIGSKCFYIGDPSSDGLSRPVIAVIKRNWGRYVSAYISGRIVHLIPADDLIPACYALVDECGQVEPDREGLFPTFEPSDLASFCFQAQLCQAGTYAQLIQAALGTDRDTRVRAMKLWEADDRYELLKAKAERLRAEEGALIAA